MCICIYRILNYADENIMLEIDDNYVIIYAAVAW